VLYVLVKRHGELVSKDEIMTNVWLATVIADSNLPIQILALRRVLDHGRAGGSCIQTVTGRDYRFVASVTHAFEQKRLKRSKHQPYQRTAARPVSVVQ
jgi:DNA-binding winged helix-turn-helix (wHTH) protein